MTKILSLDTETLGINSNAPIIELGACIVFKDGTLRPFNTIIRHEEYHYVEPYACVMNQNILNELANGGGVSPFNAKLLFHKFLNNHWSDEKIIVLGKNLASFDIPIMKNSTNNMSDICERFCNRILDIGNLYFRSSDTEPPDTSEILSRADLGEQPAHRAVNDAKLIAEAFIKWRNGEVT